MINAIWLPIFTLIMSIFVLVVAVPFFDFRKKGATIRFWAKGVVWFAGLDVEVRGAENLKGTAASVLVSNHQGTLDIPVLLGSLPIDFRMAAKVQLFQVPFFGQALLALGFVPIVRERPGATVSSFQRAKKNFELGLSVWFAPEGTRSDKDEVKNFKPGAFFLAETEKRDVIPICIYGTRQALLKNSSFINWGKYRGKVLVQVLPPIKFTGQSRDELRDLSRNQIIVAFDKLRAEF